jgi:hypothetical protein
MYTHNPPEQFSVVTRAESTCVERCEPTKFEHPPTPPSEAYSGSRVSGAPRGCGRARVLKPLGGPVLQHWLVAHHGRTLGDSQRGGGHRVLHPVIRCDESGSRLDRVVDLDW